MTRDLRTTVFRDSSITKQSVALWPTVSTTWNLPGHNQISSYPQTLKVLTDFTCPQMNGHKRVPKLQTPTNRMYQIWDKCIWLTPTVGQLRQKAILCWEQRNHTYDTWANSTRRLRNMFINYYSSGH